MTSAIGWLRIFAILEGLSYLVLLFIAMPLKYIWDKPEMVRSVGMAHGILFVVYVLLAIVVAIQFKWRHGNETLKVLVASLIPFGTFWVDYKILAPVHRGLKPEVEAKA